jgi:5-methylcytosine-specific restriction protein A
MKRAEQIKLNIKRIRPSWHKLYTKKWSAYRKWYLSQPQNFRCNICGIEVATVVDHIQDHKGDEVLFWSTTNHQPLCVVCHNTKTHKDNH